MKIDPEILYAPCPCGSGKKFKFCCLELVRDRLPDHPTQAEVTMEVRTAIQPFGLVNDIDPIEDREAIKLMQRGIEKRKAEHLDEALRLFRQSRELQPKLYTSWNNEAVCLWGLKRYDEALKAQQDGQALTGEVNSFGWAQLAEFQYFFDRDAESAASLARAMAIPPISEDVATKVCAALALQKRHADLLEYASKSGFDQSPWVAFYAGTAAMNTGDRTTAGRLLKLAQDAGIRPPLPENALLDIEDREEEADAPFGEWPYFTLHSYEAGPFVERTLEERLSGCKNVLCDLLEFMLANRSTTKKEVLESLKGLRGPRAKRLREWLATTDAFDELPPDSSGDETAAPEIPADKRFDAVMLDPSVEPGEKLEGKERKLFLEAIENWQTARFLSAKWTKARNVFKSLWLRHPDFFRAGFNYANMLRDEGDVETARDIIVQIASEHPEYAYAQAALVRMALVAKDYAEAQRLVEAYRPPVRMHPVEYRAWLRTKLDFYKSTRDETAAANTSAAIAEIEQAFRLPP